MLFSTSLGEDNSIVGFGVRVSVEEACSDGFGLSSFLLFAINGSWLMSLSGSVFDRLIRLGLGHTIVGGGCSGFGVLSWVEDRERCD